MHPLKVFKIKKKLDSFKTTPKYLQSGLSHFFHQKHVFVKHPSVQCQNYLWMNLFPIMVLNNHKEKVQQNISFRWVDVCQKLCFLGFFLSLFSCRFCGTSGIILLVFHNSFWTIAFGMVSFLQTLCALFVKRKSK